MFKEYFTKHKYIYNSDNNITTHYNLDFDTSTFSR